MKIKIIKLLMLLFMFFIIHIESTNSYLLDTETSTNNLFQAGTWGTPIISNINAFVATPNTTNNDNKAIITWDTDTPATSNVEYGFLSSESYTDIVPSPADTTASHTSHSLEITPLDPETTYYYRVRSINTYGYETISTEYSFTTHSFTFGDPSSSDIVINEFLPNPTAADDAAAPNGEWIELYNRGSADVTLYGWYLTDSNSSNILPISNGLTIQTNGFAVIYRNGNNNFDLNNILSDEVRLYDGISSTPVDQYTYNVLPGETLLENKSFARFPDGSDTWFDPIPTPGGPNKLEILQSQIFIPTPRLTFSPSIDLSYVNDKKAVSFKVVNIENYSFLSYELTYMAYKVEKGVIGSDINILNLNQYEKELDLATCSSGVCTYDENISNLKLKVILINSQGIENIIKKNL